MFLFFRKKNETVPQHLYFELSYYINKNIIIYSKLLLFSYTLRSYIQIPIFNS